MDMSLLANNSNNNNNNNNNNNIINNNNKVILEFEHTIQRDIFGAKKDENGEWRRLHNEKLHNACRPPNIVRIINSLRLRWAGNVARIEESKSAFKMLTGKPTIKRPLASSRWEDNIRKDLKEIVVNTSNCVDSAQEGIIGESL